MGIIVKGRKLASDSWLRLEPAADGTLPALPPVGDLIVPLATWQAQRDALLGRRDRVGVELDGDDDPEEFAEDLRRLGVVAVRFGKFSDGRGFTLAYLLRVRHAYRGELRACGDVIRDQLPYLESCGFDAFELRRGEDPQAALASFAAISDAYQGTVADPLPLYRRRPGAVRGAAIS